MTNYAEVNGSQVITYPYTFSSLQDENPYTNYGSNQDFLYWFPQTNASIDLGYQLVPVNPTEPPSYDPLHQYVEQGIPEQKDGEWFETWIVNDFTPEQQKAYDDARRADNKNKASQLLTETDWTAIPSVSDPAQSNPFLANQNEFLQYRSKIRAIAVNPPIVVNSWPIMPVEVWETVSP